MNERAEGGVLKMKKIIGWVLCLAVILSIGGGTCMNVSAAGEPEITYRVPHSIKIGYQFYDNPNGAVSIDAKPTVVCKNMPVGYDAALITNALQNDLCFGYHAGGGPDEIAPDGTFSDVIYADIAYKPGTFYMQVELIKNNESVKKIDQPYWITIEEPVITHNAPSTVKAGSSLTLKTELTNTALTNHKVSEYAEALEHEKDPDYMITAPSNQVHVLAYQPIVEIIEGKDLVKQSEQDYSNTLHTSETLSFRGVGTVKLKITYKQINTCGMCLWGYDGKDNCYNPEKTITIQVTDGTIPPDSGTTNSSGTATSNDDSTSSNPSTSVSSASDPSQSDTASTGAPVTTIDEETGIQLEAAPGVIPPDTVIQAKQVTEGGNFAIINNALEQTSDKWVAYDIKLLSNNAEIQPNGKVKLTIPRPKGLNMNKMVLYHIAEDGTLTQIPFTLDKTKDNIIFETDHFSTYVLAEQLVAPQSASTTEKNSYTFWIILSVVGGILLIGSGTAVWYFKFRKRPSENQSI